MRGRAYAAVVAAGICAFYAAPTGGAACVVAGAFAAQWNYAATLAYGDGDCVKIKIPTMWATWSVAGRPISSTDVAVAGIRLARDPIVRRRSRW
jgi:hypothetical protein